MATTATKEPSKMLLPELKAELSKRGLDINGKKSELMERLQESSEKSSVEKTNDVCASFET